MAKKISISKQEFNPRQYMLLAIEAMRKSIDEPRTDGKISPKVGAIIVKPNGDVEEAFRGELRHGDHAEFTLLERKNRANNLAGSILFATLEPCAPGARRHPKIGCAERIVNARIKEVWVGIADPDPAVDRKGLQYLKDNGIIVRMFDRDLQKIINDANKDFFKQAIERADGIEVKKKEIVLTPIENVVDTKQSQWYHEEAIRSYIQKSKRKIKPFSDEFWNHFEDIGMVKNIHTNGKITHQPTGFGILLFGKEPRDLFPQSVIKAKVTYGSGKPSLEEFDLPLVLMPDAVENWLKKVLHSSISRSSFQRKTATNFPIEPLREALINAIVHRDYDDKGAKTFIEIDDDKIVIKSAGLPVAPITLKEVQSFNAPSLSRNPKITYIFNRMEIMEESELGMETFRNMEQQFKLPSPIIEFKEPYLSVTFAQDFEAANRVIPNKAIQNLSNEEQAGYRWIASMPEISAKEYATKFKYSSRTVSRHLANMIKGKLIETNGESINSPKLRYKKK